MKIKVLILVATGVMLFGFQNCGQPVSFSGPSSGLVVGNDNPNGADSVPTGNTPNQGDNKPPTTGSTPSSNPTPGGGSDDGGHSGDHTPPQTSPTPGGTSNNGGSGGDDQKPTPTPASTPASTPAPTPSSGDKKPCDNKDPSPSSKDSTQSICLVGPTDSWKVQYATDLGDGNSTKNAVCISQNACEVLINNYLNLTDGAFGGTAGAPPDKVKQYTWSKDNGVCSGNNPNVKHLTDAEVQALISKLLQ